MSLNTDDFTATNSKH